MSSIFLFVLNFLIILPKSQAKKYVLIFFLKQKWKKWQYQYQCQNFLLYYRKNIFSTIGFLKSKRVSLCHKRKLPSLIKFSKTKTNRTIHTNKIWKVRYVIKVASFDFWILEQVATGSTSPPSTQTPLEFRPHPPPTSVLYRRGGRECVGKGRHNALDLALATLLEADCPQLYF